MEAICVPDIRTSLELPGLKRVVSKFIEKGYCLADDCLSNLTDEIDNIEFMLGSSSLHCLPEMNCCFGRNNASAYSDTPMGIILMGRLNSLYTDTDYLTVANSLEDGKFGIADVSVCHSPASVAPSPKNLTGVSVIQEVQAISEVVTAADGDDEDTNVSYLPNNVSRGARQVNVNFCVTKETGLLVESELYTATDSVILDSSDDVLNEKCINYLNYGRNYFNDVTCTVDDSLVKSTLDNTTRNHEDRLVMPLM